ncbi:hypothetical protein [Brumimicrobium aurantiacum]|uniref:Uncharacterized protein n=1 Tax=Brumimicrobium aurantiacum TaxID=1737063 RepID=A0A3E1EZM2_9FLAO|nr:hypothetical protein [Brumimicrobium aurantiacum]RFC55011.1 hypothetical protein DXU93_04095 [Brumimicrobium aurantiacum]
MLHAIKHNKVNRTIYKANEDALTSSVFERLMYLPQELLHYIFTTALFDTIEGLELHQIESIEFWPKWDPEYTYNKNHVEPDVFIRTVKQDIIIEAKRNDTKQQSKHQWRNEIQSYYNEYAEDEKQLVFIALGGLYSTETETIEVKEVSHQIYKCTWKSVLNTILNVTYDIEQASNYTNNIRAVLNVLSDMVMCFELFGYPTSPWLERFIKSVKINNQSIQYFSTSWTN